MSPDPTLQPLSRSNRSLIFRMLFLVFFIVMPVFVFYAMGYRIDLSKEGNIVTVGGMYITAGAEDVEIFIDEQPVVNMRIFRNAAYIQNLVEGMHRVQVSREGLHTWVKELPVFSHIVTEAQSFNMPIVPQVRVITKWLTPTGTPVVQLGSDAEMPFLFASTTNTFLATTTQRTSAFVENTEYEYVSSLFEEGSVQQNASQNSLPYFDENFVFSDQRMLTPTSTATTTKIVRDLELYEEDGEVYARWIGIDRTIPYYFCITHTSATSTPEAYGTHVYDALEEQVGTTTDLGSSESEGLRYCRDTIRIDRLQQEGAWFDFLPSSMHHVLLLLEDGLYVVEIDDRAWQNTQLLYLGVDLQARVDSGRIYVFDGTHYFEVFTSLQS